MTACFLAFFLALAAIPGSSVDGKYLLVRLEGGREGPGRGGREQGEEGPPRHHPERPEPSAKDFEAFPGEEEEEDDNGDMDEPPSSKSKSGLKEYDSDSVSKEKKHPPHKSRKIGKKYRWIPVPPTPDYDPYHDAAAQVCVTNVPGTDWMDLRSLSTRIFL